MARKPLESRKYVVIAPVGDNLEALFVGLRDFPTERVILLTPKRRMRDAMRAAKRISTQGVKVQNVEIDGNVWEEMFRKIAEIKELEKHANIIVNTASGDRVTTCAATSAAFVNGLKAMSVDGGRSMLLPVLKFSYYKLLSDRKLKILRVLADESGSVRSLDELAKRTRMSLPLISYHVNGNLKSEGLVELGLVETHEMGAKTAISLTVLGRLLVNGYVPQA